MSRHGDLILASAPWRLNPLWGYSPHNRSSAAKAARQVIDGEREFRDAGDVVVALLRPHLEGRESGFGTDFELGLVVEFEGDLARSGATYASHLEAPAAAEAINA